jgi:hypothetical protein
MKDEHEAGWAKSELFRRLFAMKAAMAAAVTREAAKPFAAATAAPAPAQFPSTGTYPETTAQAPPSVSKSAQIISLQDAALKAGYYIPSGRGQLINDEFPPDPVLENWKATQDQKPREFPPDTLDVTNADAVNRAFAEQVRIAKEKK